MRPEPTNDDDVSTVDYAQATAVFVVSELRLGTFISERPRAVGFYFPGNGDLGHHFYLTRKPGRIERFFAGRLLGLTWTDSAC